MDMLDELERKKENREQFFSRLTEKIVSRKVLVFAIATIAMFTGHIDVDTWTMISMAFIGSEAFVNTTLAWKGGKKK